MAEPTFYRCGACCHPWQRTEWKIRKNPPPICPRCKSSEQTIDRERQDEYDREVYGPIAKMLGQVITKKLESEE